MTGQIPSYGQAFFLERGVGVHPLYTHSIYVFRRDLRWSIRAAKGSKIWYLMFRGELVKVIPPQTSLTNAMETLIGGISQGYFIARPTP